MESITSAVGVDFGTTNSSLALVNGLGSVDLATFPYMGSITDAYRSILYLERLKERGANVLKSWTGPEGIEHYLSSETPGRLVQSLKSFLSTRNLVSTDVFGRRLTVEDLIARILRDLREKAQEQFGISIKAAVVGRPVRFVGADKDEDNAHAEKRLRAALEIAGYEFTEFELEPVAAAYYYESTLDHDELILIGDFGGGTSDFSLIHVGPTIRQRGRMPSDLLGNAGIGLAGDAFDAKIIRHVVSPALGAGTHMRSLHKVLPVPNWVFTKLERWHHLSFLKAKDVMDMLKSVQAQALEPEKISALIHLIKEDLGYHLHRAVQKVKADLSEHQEAMFHFSNGAVDLATPVKREDFEAWISEELEQIEKCVDSLHQSTGVHHKDVNMVFLTGGSSFVPAVRRIFEKRFGADRIRAGNEFTSVARGLGLRALSLTAAHSG